MLCPLGCFVQEVQWSDAVTATAHPHGAAPQMLSGPGICVEFEQILVQWPCSGAVQTGGWMDDQKARCWDCALRTWPLSQTACCVHKGPWFGSQRNPRV